MSVLFRCVCELVFVLQALSAPAHTDTRAALLKSCRSVARGARLVMPSESIARCES